MQNLLKIGLIAVKLLHIFDFQNGGRPPSWIWYDVIADHPRLVFDGPNILLKLHVDHVNILQDTTIFIFKKNNGLAVLTQYRRVTDIHPASHLSIASTALANEMWVKKPTDVTGVYREQFCKQNK